MASDLDYRNVRLIINYDIPVHDLNKKVDFDKFNYFSYQIP